MTTPPSSKKQVSASPRLVTLSPASKISSDGGDDDDEALADMSGISSDPATVTVTAVDSRRLRWLARHTLATKSFTWMTKLAVYVATNAAIFATALSFILDEVRLEHHAFVKKTGDEGGSGEAAAATGAMSKFKQWASYSTVDPLYSPLEDAGTMTCSLEEGDSLSTPAPPQKKNSFQLFPSFHLSLELMM
jgi:hypothetical protein